MEVLGRDRVELACINKNNIGSSSIIEIVFVCLSYSNIYFTDLGLVSSHTGYAYNHPYFISTSHLIEMGISNF